MAPDPPTAPPVESSDTLDYLRRHGRTYAREALDDRLREAGHQPEAIAAASPALEAERHPQAGPGALATFLAIAAGIGAPFLIRRGRRADHAVLGVVGAIGVAAVVWVAFSGLCLTTSGGFTV